MSFVPTELASILFEDLVAHRSVRALRPVTTAETPYYFGHTFVPGADGASDLPTSLAFGPVDDADVFAEPVDYEIAWQGDPEDGFFTIWRPVPPEGFKALGYIYTDIDGKPTDEHGVRCVRENYEGWHLLRRAILDQPYPRFDPWPTITGVKAGEYTEDASALLLSPPGSIVLQGEEDPCFNVLCLPVTNHVGPDAALPVMNDYGKPVDQTAPSVDRVVYVPFTALKDDALSYETRLRDTPFYSIEREVSYKLIEHLNNQSDVQQSTTNTVTTGITETDTQSFTASVGITIGFETGVDILGNEAKIMGSVTASLGYETSHSVEAFHQESQERKLEVASHHAGAEYVASHTLRVRRADGTVIDKASISFEASNSYLILQYPNSAPGQPSVVRSTGTPAH